MKEPWLAVLLSQLIAGIGQIYSGRIKRGSTLICFNLVLLGCASWFVFSFIGDIKIGVSLFLLLAIFHIWNLFDAYKCTKNVNAEDFNISRRKDKDPWLAVFLSSLIPGLGQIYIKRWFLGISFVVCFIALGVLKNNRPLFLIGLYAVFQAFVCYHAYVFSPTHRETSKRIIVVVAIIILSWELLDYQAILWKKYYVEAFQIPAVPEYFPKEFQSRTAMAPTLLANDRIFVRKSATYTPKRGDIIVFKSPEDPNIPHIMRLVVLEKETIEIRGKQLYINGERIKHRFLQNIEYSSEGKFGLEGEPYMVPKGSVFVLGDNSKNSRDSRFYGAVPKGNVVGKAYKIYWPPKRIRLLY